MKAKTKKTIATHTLGLLGTLILWVIANQMLYEVDMHEIWSGDWYEWDSSIYEDGGELLRGMLIAYPIVYWAVKTIWFDKDKKEES